MFAALQLKQEWESPHPLLSLHSGFLSPRLSLHLLLLTPFPFTTLILFFIFHFLHFSLLNHDPSECCSSTDWQWGTFLLIKVLFLIFSFTNRLMWSSLLSVSAGLSPSKMYLLIFYVVTDVLFLITLAVLDSLSQLANICQECQRSVHPLLSCRSLINVDILFPISICYSECFHSSIISIKFIIQNGGWVWCCDNNKTQVFSNMMNWFRMFATAQMAAIYLQRLFIDPGPDCGVFLIPYKIKSSHIIAIFSDNRNNDIMIFHHTVLLLLFWVVWTK